MKKSFTKSNSKVKDKAPNKRGSSRGKDEDKWNDYPDAKFKGSDRRPNDLSWYVPSEQILKDVARLPYSFPVGYPFSREGSLSQSPLIQDDQYDHAVSGILTMAVSPIVGNAQHPNDAINIAANGMYSFVRHLNSGSRNYDANDMLLVMSGVDSIYYTISWATRIYATMFTYSQGNRYLPKYLLDEQEVDYNDFLNNLPNFRAGLNARINRVSTIYVPAVLPIFRRHSWLFQNYYIEGDSEKDQIYQFYPRTYYVFKYDQDGAGMLLAKRFPENMTSSQLLAVLDEMIDPIIADEDANIICGDLYKAYQGNILTLSEVPDNMVMPLVYNEEVLLQFKNAKCHSVWPATEDDDSIWHNHFFSVEQSADKSYLITRTNQLGALATYRLMDQNNTNTHVTSQSSNDDKARLCAVWNEWSKDTILTTPHSNVEAGENMINTRLTLAFDIRYDVDAFWYGHVENMFVGSEWPHFFKICSVARNRNTNVITRFHHTYERVMVIDGLSANLATDFETQIPMISQFKYYPEIAMVLDYDEGVTPIEEAGRSMFEIDNYTLVDSKVIGRLHDTAIMGEYNVPRIALSST